MEQVKQMQGVSRWDYWAIGAFASFGSLTTTDIGSSHYGAMAIVSFLFVWGLLRSE